jgi:putative addiction module killer protein
MMFEITQTHEYRQWYDGLRDERGKRNIDARLNRLRAGHFGDCGPVGDGYSSSDCISGLAIAST